MNERIKRLAEQAGIHDDVCSMCPIHEIEKFTQLIAAECISVVTALSPNYPLRYKNNLLIETNHRDQIEEIFREYCVEEIKQHFGVKV